MKDLKKNFWGFFKTAFPFLAIIFIVTVFFWKVFLLKQVPIPGDFVVGVYFPWLDYKWGYAVGVPVKNPLTTDVVSFTYPMQMLAIDLLKSGKLPLWNSYILAGTPLLANFQSAPFSPTNFVYFIFDKLSAWSFQIILQHFLAATFTYFLLRYWKVSKKGATLGGIVFAFSGFNVIWSQWNGHTLAAAFIPLIILFVDIWLLEEKILSGVGISISLALLLLSGYPQVALYLLLAIFILWIVRIWKRKNWIYKTVFLGIFFTLGLGLAAFQILSGAELLFLSQRTTEPHPFEWAFLPWAKTITFLAADFFGNHSTKNYWGPQDYTSNTGFVGVVAFSLASATYILVKKKKEVLCGFILVVVSLVFAFPTPVSVFLWKSGIFGLNAASAHRSLVLFNLSIAILAAFGVDLFLKGKIRLTSLIPSGIILFTFGIYSLVYFYLGRINPNFLGILTEGGIPKFTVALRNMVIPLCAFILVSIFFFLSRKSKENSRKIFFVVLFGVAIVELFKFGWKFTPFSPRNIVFPKTPVLEFLMSQEKPVRITGSRVIPINMRMNYGLDSLEGYDAVYPLRISKLIAAINSQRSGTGPVGRYGTIDNVYSPLMNLVNTKYFLTLKKDDRGNPSQVGKIPEEFQDSRFKKVFEDKSVAILENKNVLPRAFIVYDWEVEKDEKRIIDKLLDPEFPLGKKIILEENSEVGKVSKVPNVSKVKYRKYSENESVIKTESSQDGILFVSDTFYPGWKAYACPSKSEGQSGVDGCVETKIYRADFAFRAVPIKAGVHEIRFTYKPESFFKGVKISIVSLLSLISVCLLLSALGKAKEGRYTLVIK